MKLDTELSPPAQQERGEEDCVGQAAPERPEPYGEAKEHRQGVTPANPSDDSAPPWAGSQFSRGYGRVSGGRHRRSLSWEWAVFFQKHLGTSRPERYPYHGPQEQGGCATVLQPACLLT